MLIDRHRVDDLSVPQEILRLIDTNIEPLRDNYVSYFVDAFSAAGRASTTRKGVDALQLAIAVFRTPIGTSSYSTRTYGVKFEETYHSTTTWDSLRWARQPRAFDQWWAFDLTSSLVVEKIIQACGMDPGQCTHSQLEELDPYVVCPVCDDVEKTKAMDQSGVLSIPVLNWDSIVCFTY